jgi:Tfp pilus tip-associated adhesin PilY1
MGRAFRAALDNVKWPIKDTNGNITGYESKPVVFVATGFARIAQSHGGINVFAFDLKTGDRLWYFSSRYSDSVNDIPGAVTPFDTTGDGLVDQIFVGDMNGRMWQLDAVNGSNPNGFDTDAGKEIPLWNAGVGNPISISPAIVKVNPVIVVFGTGGTDWASTANNKQYYLYAINSTVKQGTPTYASGAGTSYWTNGPVALPAGEKVWSTPTIAAGMIYLSASTGTMESTNPRNDLAGAGRVMAISLNNGSEDWSISTDKVRGSLYVDRGHVYLTTIENRLVQIGSGNFAQTNTNNVILKSWRQLD